MMKSLKKISCFILMMICFFSCTLGIQGAYFNEIDFDSKGSLTLSFQDATIDTGEFTLYQVGTIDETGNSLGFIYTDEFKHSEMPLDNLKADGLAAYLANYTVGHLEGMIQPIKQGQVVWNDLELGLYLVVQTENANGYYGIDPFLVSLPLEDKVKDQWIYDVDASPKMKPTPIVPSDTELTVKKVWIDEESQRPKQIHVTLYRDQIAYEKIVLNQDNNWQYTWKNLSDNYIWTVKETIVPEGYIVSYNQYENVVVITNTGDELINTGQLKWPIPVLAISGIMLFSLGWFLTFIKKDTKHEK